MWLESGSSLFPHLKCSQGFLYTCCEIAPHEPLSIIGEKLRCTSWLFLEVQPCVVPCSSAMVITPYYQGLSSDSMQEEPSPSFVRELRGLLLPHNPRGGPAVSRFDWFMSSSGLSKRIQKPRRGNTDAKAV